MNVHTPAATKGLGTAALLLVAALGWLLALRPETTDLDEVRAGIQAARDQNSALQLQLLSLTKQADELPATRKRAEVLAEIFPPTAAQPGLFDAVTDAAQRAGLPADDVTALTPTEPLVGTTAPGTGVQPGTVDAGIAQQTVTVTVEGSYEEIRQLLENLELMPRAYLITSVTLGAGTTGTAYATTITGSMFLMPPATPPAAVATGGADTPASDE